MENLIKKIVAETKSLKDGFTALVSYHSIDNSIDVMIFKNNKPVNDFEFTSDNKDEVKRFEEYVKMLKNIK